MHSSRLLVLTLTLVATVFASTAEDFANGLQQGQRPIISIDEPITKTKTLTRTHYEINIVSTVYRTRTHVHHPNPTPHVHLEEAEQTLVFGVEGTGCDLKACTICRMLNNCSDKEENCTGCDLAYYCNQCPSKAGAPLPEPEGIHVRHTCSRGPRGETIPCQGIERTDGEKLED